MSLFEKDGASIAKGDEANAKVYRFQNEGFAPPAYTERTGSTSQNPARRYPAPPSNLVGIAKSYGAVKGTWVVNTDLAVPEALLPSLSDLGSPKERPNLHLSTATGEIKVTIYLASTTRRKAKINLSTGYGAVEAHVLHRDNKQPFNLVVFSSYGNMKITVPRDFVGPLRCVTGWGEITYSEELQKNVMTLSKDMAFVGDLGRSGFVDFESWKGDEADIKTSYGNIYVQYADEYKAEDGRSLSELIADWAEYR